MACTVSSCVEPAPSPRNEDLALQRLRVEPHEREIQHLLVIGGGVRAGVPRPQDPGQRFARLIQVAGQRMVTEAVLETRLCAVHGPWVPRRLLRRSEVSVTRRVRAGSGWAARSLPDDLSPGRRRSRRLAKRLACGWRSRWARATSLIGTDRHGVRREVWRRHRSALGVAPQRLRPPKVNEILGSSRCALDRDGSSRPANRSTPYLMGRSNASAPAIAAHARDDCHQGQASEAGCAGPGCRRAPGPPRWARCPVRSQRSPWRPGPRPADPARARAGRARLAGSGSRTTSRSLVPGPIRMGGQQAPADHHECDVVAE
jgi:hypothetical protein